MATIQSHLLSIKDYCRFSQHSDQPRGIITSRTISAPYGRMVPLVMHSVASLKWRNFCLPIANLHNTCLPTLHKFTKDLPLFPDSQAGHVRASGQSYTKCTNFTIKLTTLIISWFTEWKRGRETLIHLAICTINNFHPTMNLGKNHIVSGAWQ